MVLGIGKNQKIRKSTHQKILTVSFFAAIQPLPQGFDIQMRLIFAPAAQKLSLPKALFFRTNWPQTRL
ncbi:MAG: hypothetical protein EAY75_13405 [Bacteroidetes bacterium]|nr:MAG: hypothetical protein EAY75_13405 [Bacteroidota bacterium]